jgi:hypothetical protein
MMTAEIGKTMRTNVGLPEIGSPFLKEDQD